MPASAITKPEPMPVIEEASAWLRSALVVRMANRRSSSARIRAGEIVDMVHGVASDAFATRCLAASLMRCDAGHSIVVRNSSIRCS